MTANPTCRQDTPRRDDMRRTEAPIMRIVPRTLPALPQPLDAADWHLLFDAVLARLHAVAENPATAATAVPECVQAMQCLQTMLAPQAAGGPG
jgi:hypothetical protein